MPIHLTAGTLTELLHAIFVAGIIAVRYLWPLWLIVIALWLVTRGMRAVGHFLGFDVAGKTAKPVARPRR